jgi:PKD repeat protein
MKKENLLSLKKILALFILSISGVLHANAQATVITYDASINDSISVDTHWTACNQYFIKGWIYVTNGHTLTIDPGTIIKGDKASKGTIIVERGAKMIAAGTVTQPIVFTSNQPAGSRTYGDWGGVILCGKAENNWAGATPGFQQVEGGPRSLYGNGTSPLNHDNSGIMSYCRIEFAGVAFSPNNEVNGLSLYSVGDGTQLDHIQISYSGDDSFEWFGGTVNGKYLVAYAGWDDDFDMDCGYRGKNQFLAGIRDPFVADQSGSKGFEVDSYQTGTKTGLAGDTSGLTRPVCSNVTLIGPLVSPTSTSFDPQFVAGVHIRRGAALSLMNSIIAGYPSGILFDESSASYGSTMRNYQILGSGEDSTGQIRNNIICGIPTNLTPAKKEYNYIFNGARSLTPTSSIENTAPNDTAPMFTPFAGPYAMLGVSGTAGSPLYNNRVFPTEQTQVRMTNPFSLSNPNLVPLTSSIVFINLGSYVKVAPSFTSKKLQDAFFTPTSYVGAFGNTGAVSDNWMLGWTNFDCQNTNYNGTAAPLATITPTGSTTVCPTSAVTLNANTGAGYTYQWQLAGTDISGATSGSYNALTAGVYTVVVSNAGGCGAASSSVTVSHFATPVSTITAGGPVTFCAGNSVALTAVAGATSYLWSTGSTASSIIASTGGNVNVTITDANGCQATSTPTLVTVNPLPAAPIVSAGGPTSFCTGSTVTLTSSAGTTYLWSPGGATTSSIVVGSTGNYSVTIGDVNGCTATSTSQSVNVSSAPLPTIAVSGGTSICAGQTTTLTSSTSDSYLWSPGGATTQSIPVSASGSYNVTTTNAIACSGVGTSSSTTVTVNPIPTAAGSVGTTTGYNVNFTNTSTGATSYTWNFGDLSSSSATAPAHTYPSNGAYTVTLIASNGTCTDTISFVVNMTVGIAEASSVNGFNVYPNPVTDFATISVNLEIATKVIVTIFDITGKAVMNLYNAQMNAGQNSLEIDASKLNAGIYFVSLKSSNSNKTLKLVVSK